MFQSKVLSVALQQWLDVILDYSFTVRYRLGVLNVLPDMLSRMLIALYDRAAWGTGVPASGVEVDDDGKPQSNADSDLTVATAMVEATFCSSRPSSQSIESSSKLVPTPVRSSMVVEDRSPWPSVQSNPSLLVHDRSQGGSDPSCITMAPTPIINTSPIDSATSVLLLLAEQRGMVIPKEEDRRRMVENEHAMGHFGRDAIYKALWSKNCWWPNMRSDINDVLISCDACTRYTVTTSGFHPAQFITSNGPWDHIQLDTSVHLPASSDGYTCLLVVIDVFTGFKYFVH